MEFSIDDRTRDFSQRVREFLDREVQPLEENIERSFAQLLGKLNDLRQQAKAQQLWAPQLPVELGGQGLDFLQFAHVSEQLGRSPLGHYVLNCQAPDAGNMEILQEFGTPDQQQTWLKPLANGEIRSCFSMTEPDRPGSNPVWMDTSAVRDGNEYVINGRKWFTTAADGAAVAIVMAVTDPDAEAHQRATLFLVPTDTAGFRHVRKISCMGHEGEDWMSHSEIAYEECRVPSSHIIGQLGSGFAIAQARLGPGRIHHCMRWLGICERSFEVMCQRAATREVAPGEMLGSRQTIQNWIAESRAEIDAARLLVLQTAWKIDRLGQKQARSDVSAIKFFVARILMDVIDRAIQTCGALGISDDLLLSFFYRQERGARIYDGPDEVHKSSLARRILRQYTSNQPS